jgi:hypothetical protein
MGSQGVAEGENGVGQGLLAGQLPERTAFYVVKL